MPPRSFFWSVLFTLRGDFCDDLITEAAEERGRIRPAKDPKNTILNIGIAKEWADVLLESPFISSKFDQIAIHSLSEVQNQQPQRFLVWERHLSRKTFCLDSVVKRSHGYVGVSMWLSL